MRVSMLHAAMVAVAPSAVVPSTQAPDNAAKILANARRALGGEPRLSAVRSFTVKGDITQGHSQPYGTFEIACELPDKFIQKTVLAHLGGGGPSASDSRGCRGSSGYGGIGAYFGETTLGSSVPLQFIDSPGPDDGPTIIVKDRVNAVMRFDKITHPPANLVMRAARGGVPAGMREQWDVKAFHVNATIDPKMFRPSGAQELQRQAASDEFP